MAKRIATTPPSAPQGRCWGYARTTAEQSREGVSLAEQERRVTARALEISPAGLERLFVEDGVSGSIALAVRPKGRQMMALVRPGDTVIAAKLDRLFRSAADALAVVEDFRRRGIGLVALDVGDMTGNGVSALVTTILAAVAGFEGGWLRERITESKAQLRHEGRHMGGTTPFGYRLGPVVGKGRAPTLIPNEKEQAAIAEIVRRRAAGQTLMAIKAAMLTRHGIRLSHQTVANIVARAAAGGYDPAGKFTWNEGSGIEIIKPGTGEPLLSEAELDNIIAANRRAR